MQDDYNIDMQQLYITVLLSHPETFTKMKRIVNPDHFDGELKKAITVILEYSNEYHGLPSVEYINAKLTEYKFKTVNIDYGIERWIFNEYPKFAKHKAIEDAVIKASALIAEKKYEDIEALIKDAMKVRLSMDFGLNLTEAPKENLENILKRSGTISSGFKGLDEVVGKFSEGDLVFYMGGSGCVTYDTPVKIIKLPKHSNNNRQPQTVPIGSLMNVKEDTDYDYLVDSPDGWVCVLDCVEKTKNEMYHVVFDCATIDASHDHLFQKPDGSWWYTRDLVKGDNILSDTGTSSIQSITKYIEDTIVYDLSVDHDNHRYYTDGICSHNTGKSLFLMNTARYAMMQGLNVMYVTLELNPELCARRMYSMVTGMSQKDLYTDLNLTQGIVKKFESDHSNGSVQLKYMPSGTKVGEVTAFCEEFMITTGKKLDMLCVDYLDLVDPSRTMNTSSNVFDKDKIVSEEIRNFGQEHGITIITAAQAGRSAVGAEDLDHSHISGGISKINTADLVLGIITTNALRERGEYHLQIMKTRNSAGTGRKVNLKINPHCMRIEDDPDFLRNLGSFMTTPIQSTNPSNMTTTEKMFAEVQNELNKNDPVYQKVDLKESTQEEEEDFGLGDDQLTKLEKMMSRNTSF